MSAHQITFRAYYEDTDAGGIVYYANYLKFAERARTEWLRGLGYNGPTFAQEHKLAFVVRRVEACYLKPARLDDLLEVTSNLVQLRRSSLALQQLIGAGAAPDITFCRMQVELVCVATTSLKPCSIPPSLGTRLAACLPNE